MHAFVMQLGMLTAARDNWMSSLAVGGMHLSQTAATVLITAVWQGAIIAVCFGLSLRIGKRIPAGLRFALWAGGFLAVLGLPFLPMFVRTELWHVAPSSSAAVTQSWLQLDERWSIAIALVWAAASMYRAADLVIHSIKLRRLWTSAVPMQDQPISALRLWGRKPIEICTSNALDRPSVIGFFAPRILIPSWLAPQMLPEELEQIILHETEHLRRGDDWTNLLQKLSLVVFPLNPALLWMERQLCLEREMACDEAVIRVTRAPKAYAACLTNLAERGLDRRLAALSLGAWQRKPELVQRVHSILKRRQLLSPLGTRGVVAFMAGSLLIGTVELARCPQLVTFTAASSKQLSARTAVPALPAPGISGDSVYHDSPRALPVNSTGMGNAHMVELRATMPVQAGVPFHSSASAVHSANWSRRSVSLKNHARALQPNTMRSKLTAAQPAEQTLKADLNDNNPYLMETSSVVVFTAWEEVSPQTNGDQLSSESEAAVDANSADARSVDRAKQDSNASDAQKPGRVAVTQFVFRVVPASYRSTSQAIVPFRNGWLIIQL